MPVLKYFDVNFKAAFQCSCCLKSKAVICCTETQNASHGTQSNPKLANFSQERRGSKPIAAMGTNPNVVVQPLGGIFDLACCS